MARPQSTRKAGFYPTPPKALRDIADHIEYRITFGTRQDTDEYRLLDPCCGEGTALATIADHLATPGAPFGTTFGVELSQERAQKAARNLQNVMNADLFHSSIANDNFSLLFLNPPYDTRDSETQPETRIRTEFAFLQRCTQYLTKQAGVLVLIVQRKFLDQRTIRFLANHYHSISCHEFPEDERETFGQIWLGAYRKTEPFQEQDVEQALTRWALKPETIQDENDLWTIPALTRREVHFNNTYHDPWKAAEEARTSGLWNSQEIQEILNPPHAKHTSPLVPLRQGHIALLTAAGFLDDKELTDQDGTRVLVKGNIEKKLVTTQHNPDRHIRQERLEITITALNLLTGEFHDIRP